MPSRICRRPRQDYEQFTIGWAHKEAILSYTVLVLWLRQVQLLRVTVSMGSFGYMLYRMLQDIMRWIVMYGFACLAFSSALYVLFRNHRAVSPAHFPSISPILTALASPPVNRPALLRWPRFLLSPHDPVSILLCARVLGDRQHARHARR